MAEPVGERVARVETKVDGLTSGMTQVLERMAALATQGDVARIQAEVDDVKSSRRWALATFLPILVSILAVGVAVSHHA